MIVANPLTLATVRRSDAWRSLTARAACETVIVMVALEKWLLQPDRNRDLMFCVMELRTASPEDPLPLHATDNLR